MNMGMGMSLSPRQSMEMSQRVTMKLSFGEHSGDIPLYSLHRIRALSQRQPIAVSAQLNQILKQQIVAANASYRRESGNNWNCLTSLNLVAAIEGTNEDVKRITTGPGAIPENFPSRVAAIKMFDEHRVKSIGIIQTWFDVNFDDLYYSIGGKVPWFVIQRLQRNLREWISSGKNPFREGIEGMILDVAKEHGFTNVETAEGAWEAMGGTLFNK